MEQPSFNKKHIKDLMAYRLSRSKEDLEVAKLLVKNNSYLAANNRIYYAVFHAVLAVQSNDGIQSKKHGQIIGEFNKNYIRTEIFSKEFGKNIREIQRIRHSSDYDDFYVANKKETKENLKFAKEIISEVGKYLKENFDVKLDYNTNTR